MDECSDREWEWDPFSFVDGVIDSGSRRVYFQPPESYKLFYPCIVYSLDRANTRKADNMNYNVHDCYQVTVIEHDPDSGIWRRLLEWPGATFSRRYVADNLYHTVISIYN